MTAREQSFTFPTGRILEGATGQSAPADVDLRHFDSAAANIRRAAEAVGAFNIVPVLEQQNAKLREQYAPAPSPAVPVSNDSSRTIMPQQDFSTGSVSGTPQPEPSAIPKAKSPLTSPQHISRNGDPLPAAASGEGHLFASPDTHRRPEEAVNMHAGSGHMSPSQSRESSYQQPVDLSAADSGAMQPSKLEYENEPTFRGGVSASPPQASPQVQSARNGADRSPAEKLSATSSVSAIDSFQDKRRISPDNQDLQTQDVQYGAIPSQSNSSIAALPAVIYEAESIEYEPETIPLTSGQDVVAPPINTRSPAGHTVPADLSPTRSRKIEYETLVDPSQQPQSHAFSSRPVVYDDMEYEEVFREPGKPSISNQSY